MVIRMAFVFILSGHRADRYTRRAKESLLFDGFIHLINNMHDNNILHLHNKR